MVPTRPPFLNASSRLQAEKKETKIETMADGRAIVEKALDQLKSSLVDEDSRVFSDSTLEDVWKAAREIEQEQTARASLQNMRRIEPILRSLESYASVMNTFCQGFSPMAFVWVCRDPLAHKSMSGS